MQVWATTAAASGGLSDPEALLLRAVVLRAQADARREQPDAARFLEALGAPERLRLPVPADWPVRLVDLVRRQIKLRVALQLLGVSRGEFAARCSVEPGLLDELAAARRYYHRGTWPAAAAPELCARAVGEGW